MLALAVLIGLNAVAQKETKVNAEIKRVTVFKSGAQVEHQKSINVSNGRQLVVFEKLTDYLDPGSIQLKCSENATIISVRTRKNYDDKTIAQNEVDTKNTRKKELEKEERILRDEYKVLLLDEQLLQKNNTLGSQQQGVKISELKEASTFFHAKMSEILSRKSQLEDDIETLVRKKNIIEQEIATRKSLPVINYSEIEVEIEAKQSGNVQFDFNYITSNASWKPYYDMRSAGIGSPVTLEAKGLVTQNTGINWNNVNLILSTNDPYDDTQEPVIATWKLDYYTPLPQKQTTYHYVPEHNYSGETIHGEVTDITTGEPLAFAKITFPSAPQLVVTSDATGKFSFQVPNNVTYMTISYLGYGTYNQTVNSPYLKIQMTPETIAMDSISYSYDEATSYMSMDKNIEEVMISGKALGVMGRKKSRFKNEAFAETGTATYAYTSPALATVAERDLRMEFTIEKPFSVPSDDAEHRVAIANYQMNATYEYHAVPKLDKDVYLVALISGWEKMNILSGESNLYFDGTFIGKTYIDVNSTKDTLGFSLGKDKKVQITREKVDELSKTKASGSRTKYEVTWEFTVRNNGPFNVPILIKDQFPVSVNGDIKVKQGNYDGATLEEETGILTWKTVLNKGETKKFRFDFSVEYGKNGSMYLE